ncbi:hypothetical protein EV1_042925 [Malus domestica]
MSFRPNIAILPIISPLEQLSRLGWGRVESVEYAQLVVVHGLLGGVKDDVPGLGDQPEGIIREAIPMGVQQKSESTVLSRDDFEVLSVLGELENSVPVGLLVLVVDLGFNGEKSVGDGNYLLGGLEPGVSLSGSDRESLGLLQVMRRQ